MSSAWAEVLTTTLLNGLILCLCLLAFYKVVMPFLLRDEEEDKKIRGVATLQWKDFDAELMNDVLPTQKLAAELYFEFFNLLLKLAILMCFGNVLMSTINYYQGNEIPWKEENVFFSRSSTFNISYDSDVLWAHALYVWLFSFACIILVVQYRKTFRELDQKHDYGVSEYTLQIVNLPVQAVDPYLMKAAILERHPGVREVHIAYELSELLDLMTEVHPATPVHPTTHAPCPSVHAPCTLSACPLCIPDRLCEFSPPRHWMCENP